MTQFKEEEEMWHSRWTIFLHVYQLYNSLSKKKINCTIQRV